MPLVAMCSVKGRPGVTTAALGLAAVASARSRPVLVEVDPAGGDLAGRHRLAWSPGLVELATAARRMPNPDEELLSWSAQRVAVGDRAVEVVVAPAGGAQVRVALSVLAQQARGGVLACPDRLVIVDCGRVHPGCPVWPLLGAADAVLVLTAGRVEDVAHLREHVPHLSRLVGDRVAVLVAGGGPYGVGDVAAALPGADGLAVRVAGELPEDTRAAEILGGQLRAGSRWRRLPLIRALGAVAGSLPASVQAEWIVPLRAAAAPTAEGVR